MATAETKAIVKKRGSIIEHPFGTIKRTLGWDHFLVRTKKKVLGENDLIQIREEIATYILVFRLNLG